MGIKERIKEKMLKEAAKKSEAAMPRLKAFAISSDAGYNSLIKTIRGINKNRKEAGKYIFKLSDRASK